MFPQLPFDLFSEVHSEGSDYFALLTPTHLQEGGGVGASLFSLSAELLLLFVFILSPNHYIDGMYVYL